MPNRGGVPILIDGPNSTELVPVELTGKNALFDESWIQTLVDQHPICIPIAQIEPGFGTLHSICRELPTAHGYIDNLLMTTSGDIVIVEAKLWRNPQARREVVAQALDYASCLFRMDYEAFETAIKKASFGDRHALTSLYETFSNDPEVPSEKDFVEAVSRNLQRGNIVVLVLGDGIRTEVKLLADVLQSHAGFHFTFALVELNVFKIPNGGLLVIPGVLAKTEMIERGIVRIEDGKATISSAPATSMDASTRSISAEKFFETMELIDPTVPDKLKAFIGRLESLGGYPEYRKSLNLKWEPPTGKPVNLGYITPQGAVWTDAVNWSIPHKLSHAYLEDFAQRIGGQVNRNSPSGNYFVTIGGHTPKIGQIKNNLNSWYDAAENLITSLKARSN